MGYLVEIQILRYGLWFLQCPGLLCDSEYSEKMRSGNLLHDFISHSLTPIFLGGMSLRVTGRCVLMNFPIYGQAQLHPLFLHQALAISIRKNISSQTINSGDEVVSLTALQWDLMASLLQQYRDHLKQCPLWIFSSTRDDFRVHSIFSNKGEQSCEFFCQKKYKAGKTWKLSLGRLSTISHEQAKQESLYCTGT